MTKRFFWVRLAVAAVATIEFVQMTATHIQVCLACLGLILALDHDKSAKI